ncbi:MAG: DUF2085 domain-containing protein [Thermoanaerobaculia bacterium]
MTTTAKVTAVLLALAVGIVPIAALAVTLARVEGAPAWLEIPFRLTCHGIDARALAIDGIPMPICARCLAIYAGGLAGIFLFLVPGPWRRYAVPTLFFLVALVPMGVDGVTQALGLRESTNALRMATGFPAGLVALVWVLGRIDRAARQAP